MTLIELLVTMVIFSIAMALVTVAVSKVNTTARDVQFSADANDQVRLSLADIDRQVRSGNVLNSPADEVALLPGCTSSTTVANAGTCMRVYTQANGYERCVQWEVLADPAKPGTSLLRSRSWSPNWQTDGNFSPWSTKGRGLTSSPSASPFTLRGAATASSSRYLVVQLEAIDARRPGKTAILTSSVSGRNTVYGYDAGLCSPLPPS